MPPRTKKDPAAPSTMKELKDTLWKAADKLRGSMDASQYKDVILGLVFLKYVSDAFEERRGQIRAELAEAGLDEDQIAQLIDDLDEYHGHGVFWVPPHGPLDLPGRERQGPARDCDEPSRRPSAQLIDDAMDLVMGDNPSLAGTLPRIYNRDNVDQRRLGELLDLFNSARFSRPGRAAGPRPARRGLRVLPGEVRPRRGQARRRVLHPGQRGPGPRRGARAAPRPRLRPVLRLGRHVRAGREVHLRATTATPRTSPSTARSSTSAPGGWPR